MFSSRNVFNVLLYIYIYILCSGLWTQVVIILIQTTICDEIVIFTGKSIYKRETVSIKNIVLVIK